VLHSPPDLSRVRISLGTGRVTFLLTRVLALSCVLFLAAAVQGQPLPIATDVPKVLPIIKAANWETDFIGWWAPEPQLPTAPSPIFEPVAFRIGDCNFLGQHVTLAPGQSAVYTDIGAKLCNPFALFEPPTTVPTKVRLRFNDGVTATSFVVKPLGALMDDRKVRLQPVENAGAIGTYLNLFKRIPEMSSVIAVDLYDAKGAYLGRELAGVSPPFSQYRIMAELTAGSVELSLFRSRGPVWGFASISNETGGNAEVIEFP
jgi:hypothetical protein